MNCIGWWSKLLPATLALILFLSVTAAGQTCATTSFTGALDDGTQSDVNTNLNAYAAIFNDSALSAGSSCNASAAMHLRTKLANTYGPDPSSPPSHLDQLQRSVAPFHGWLEGAYVTYIFPAAIRLNEAGLLNSDSQLKSLLQNVADSTNSLVSRPNGFASALISIDGSCGLNATAGFTNNCMDDYSVAAAGFAWAAAYENLVANGSERDQLVDAANFAINKSFDANESICIVPNTVVSIRDPQPMPANGRGPCTGTALSSASPAPPNLQDNTAVTLSLNHGHETPAYGYGLMTSISSAVLGLKLAGSNHNFSQDQRTIAQAILLEANRLTEPTGSPFPSDYRFINRPPQQTREACLKVTVPDSQHFQITAPFNNPDVTLSGDCADFGYQPRMYPVSDFYNTFIGSVPATLPLGFGASLFSPSDSGGFFGLGREVYYGSLGWDQRTGIMTPLAPLPPTPVYPADNTLHAPSGFALRWNDGLDPSRRYPWWPVTYAIYYKAWPYGGAEPAAYTLFGSNFLCNADSTGACSLQVSNVSDGNYRFYVVASMDETLPGGNSVLTTQSSTSYFTVGYQPISTIPAPLPPNPIYPSDGTLHAPSSFALRWSDGLDASRRSPFWPVTYAIYYKAWSYGTAEPANYFLFGSGFSCNPDSTGACTLSVSNVSRGNYRWYIVANMDVSQSTGTPGSVLSTQGSVAFFTIGYDASVSIAWIQPSATSWGPPNTLTAAGFATGGVGGVALQWRDATLNGLWNTVSYQAPPDPSNGSWSNTIPSADTCHVFQAMVQYSGVSASRDYDGVALGYCSFRVIWIQPQSTAGFGPAGSLVVAGSANGGPSGALVTLWYRDDTIQSGWTQVAYQAPTDANGIWYNAIQNVDYTHQYSVYITYDNRNSAGTCSYYGNNSITNCP